MAEATSPSVRVGVEPLRKLCLAGMSRAGMREADARLLAEVHLTNDTWGIHTHGVKLLYPLFRNVREGHLSVTAIPEVVSEGPAWALVNGHRALPAVTAHRAMSLALEKARGAGIAYVGVRGSGNFGTAAYYANMAAEQDMIGLVCTNADPTVVPPGAVGPGLGTNPLACAAPAGEEKPLLLDMAISVVAAGKVLAARARGEEIPDDWLIGPDGQPTADLGSFALSSWLAPLGGYKGFGLGMVVEVLAGVLTGAGITSDITSWMAERLRPNDIGHAFLAINLGAMMPVAEFKARMDRMIRQIKATPRAPGVERITLPGEREAEKREAALAQGVPLPSDVVANLLRWAEDYGLGAEARALCGEA